MVNIRTLNRGLIITGIGFILSYLLLMYLVHYFLDEYNGAFQDFIYNLNICFTSEQFYVSLSRLQAPLRDHYIHTAFIDFMVLFFYASFGTLLTIRLRGYFFGFTNLWTWKHSFFIMAALANFFSDLCFIVLFSRYPTQISLLVILANWLTLIKFLCLAFGIIYIIYLFIAINTHSVRQ